MALPRAEIEGFAPRNGAPAALAVAARFRPYDWIEIGWGDERFYRDVPTLGAFNWRLGLRALFAPGNASVVHVAGIEGDPRRRSAARMSCGSSCRAKASPILAGYRRFLRP